MFKFLNTKWKSFRRDEEGVTLVEYGIAIVLAITVGTGALIGLGGDINGQMDDACTVLSGGVC
ncbi:Flp family type IVb pilin [Cereibacter sphaeroides]|uniref:Flp family type IVb pilin n=1 Tax=Cereibacter sphaeroides TaxID=1063 RepID=UPI001F4625AF|nr:Flp family type IVb pilin [Cereibacter sphaeroides]MCE6970010.1 Flp family type IVb pilin [Cereibacter sphaeroides]